MCFKNLIYQEQDGILYISFNKPEIKNAIDIETRSELLSALKKAGESLNIKVVVITGENGNFSAGGSLKDLKDPIDVFAGRAYCEPATTIIKQIVMMEKPVIAAVDGYAVGAGFSIVLASDLAIATDRALFSQIFIQISLTPDYGSCYFLPRAVGLKRAKELAFTGKMISAYEAHTLGIVNKVVEPEKFKDEIKLMAENLTRGPSKAIGLTKRLFNRSYELDLDTVFELELMATSMCFQTEDHKESVKAFLKKQKPTFSGK